jgi:hypothetical protein
LKILFVKQNAPEYEKTQGKPTTIEQSHAFLSSYYIVYWFKKKFLGDKYRPGKKNDKMNKIIKVILSDARAVYA